MSTSEFCSFSEPSDKFGHSNFFYKTCRKRLNQCFSTIGVMDSSNPCCLSIVSTNNDFCGKSMGTFNKECLNYIIKLYKDLSCTGAALRCLPFNKPSACSITAWNKIKVIFVGDHCPEDNYEFSDDATSPNNSDNLLTIIGGSGGLPPTYLSVIGHEDCLGSYEVGPVRIKCLPKDKPSTCSNVIWKELNKVWEGNKCPYDNDESYDEALDRPKNIGGTGGIPPSYLSVEGHEDCLGTYDAPPTRIKCLPLKKPSACSKDIWHIINKVFEGEHCPNHGEDALESPRYTHDIGEEYKCKSPKIKWKGCVRIGGRHCDACFSIEFDDFEGGYDTLCMEEVFPCIFTGNLINDGSHVSLNFTDGKCGPFGSDPLEVFLSSERCSGSWKVDDPSPSNGISKREISTITTTSSTTTPGIIVQNAISGICKHVRFLTRI